MNVTPDTIKSPPKITIDKAELEEIMKGAAEAKDPAVKTQFFRHVLTNMLTYFVTHMQKPQTESTGNDMNQEIYHFKLAAKARFAVGAMKDQVCAIIRDNNNYLALAQIEGEELEETFDIILKEVSYK